MPRVLHRGFVFNDDFAGAAVTFKGEGFEIPFIWLKAYEGGTGKDMNDFDVDWYALKPNFKFGSVSLTPTLSVHLFEGCRASGRATSGNKEIRIWMAGVDADVKLGAGSLWFTGIYEGGDVEMLARRGSRWTWRPICWPSAGRSMWVPRTFTARFSMPPGMTRRRRTTRRSSFRGGQRHSPTTGRRSWVSGSSTTRHRPNSPADKISNIMAANIGVGFKVSDKLKLMADLWYAKLVEKNAKGDDELGTEIDLVLTYSLMKNLNLDLVAAYLFAGDATYKGANDEDPYEIGTQLSFRF